MNLVGWRASCINRNKQQHKYHRKHKDHRKTINTHQLIHDLRRSSPRPVSAHHFSTSRTSNAGHPLIMILAAGKGRRPRSFDREMMALTLWASYPASRAMSRTPTRFAYLLATFLPSTEF